MSYNVLSGLETRRQSFEVNPGKLPLNRTSRPWSRNIRYINRCGKSNSAWAHDKQELCQSPVYQNLCGLPSERKGFRSWVRPQPRERRHKEQKNRGGRSSETMVNFSSKLRDISAKIRGGAWTVEPEETAPFLEPFPPEACGGNWGHHGPFHPLFSTYRMRESVV